MREIGSLNLIHFLDFYFALMFFAGILRRFGQYQSVAKLIFSGPTRWPRLLKLLSQYRTIFWTWATVMPALLALGLWLIQLLASRSVFPQAGKPPDGLTVERLMENWLALLAVVPLGVSMLGFDLYSLYAVGQFDRVELEKHFDEAEYWLRSSTASVLRVVTFGFINPRRMVADEVQKALAAVSDMLNLTLWWVSVQMGLRFCFALALWLIWAVTH